MWMWRESTRPRRRAEHDGLTVEELDFIVNDDVKDRMGDELAAEG